MSHIHACLKALGYKYHQPQLLSRNSPHILAQRPSKASISLIRWPLPIPPKDGLHDISPTTQSIYTMLQNRVVQYYEHVCMATSNIAICFHTVAYFLKISNIIVYRNILHSNSISRVDVSQTQAEWNHNLPSIVHVQCTSCHIKIELCSATNGAAISRYKREAIYRHIDIREHSSKYTCTCMCMCTKYCGGIAPSNKCVKFCTWTYTVFCYCYQVSCASILLVNYWPM